MFTDLNLSETETYLQRAIAVAVNAHNGQYYNVGNGLKEPYIFHVMRTASNVIDNTLTQDENNILQTIAVLHDIVEDTFITPQYLKGLLFPDYIIDNVVWLTKDKFQSYEEYINRLQKSERAVRVKLADLKENISNLYRLPEDKALKMSMKYIPTQQKLIQRLKEICDAG